MVNLTKPRPVPPMRRRRGHKVLFWLVFWAVILFGSQLALDAVDAVATALPTITGLLVLAILVGLAWRRS